MWNQFSLFYTKMINVPFKKLHPNAKKPTKGTSGSAGFDIYTIETMIVPAHSQVVFDTGIAMHIPNGIYVRVAPRSGFAFRHCFNVHAGVIDNDFTDEIKVMIFNHSNGDVTINEGERIAQLIFEKYESNIELCEYHELPVTDRCDGIRYGGFGSTGK